MPDLAQIPCPGCGTEVPVPLTELRPGNSVKCPGCDARIDFEGTDVGAAFEEIEDAMAMLGATRVDDT